MRGVLLEVRKRVIRDPPRGGRRELFHVKRQF